MLMFAKLLMVDYCCHWCSTVWSLFEIFGVFCLFCPSCWCLSLVLVLMFVLFGAALMFEVGVLLLVLLEMSSLKNCATAVMET